jgi:hypothetical protein
VQAKQSKEHSEKQDDVGDEGNDEGWFDLLAVEYGTGLQRGDPRRAKLHKDESTWPEVAEFDYSPARHLTQDHVCMGLSIVWRRGEGEGLALDDK